MFLGKPIICAQPPDRLIYICRSSIHTTEHIIIHVFSILQRDSCSFLNRYGLSERFLPSRPHCSSRQCHHPPLNHHERDTIVPVLAQASYHRLRFKLRSWSFPVSWFRTSSFSIQNCSCPARIGCLSILMVILSGNGRRDHVGYNQLLIGRLDVIMDGYVSASIGI